MDVLVKFILGAIVIALPLAEVARLPFNDVAVTLLDVGVAATVALYFLLKRRIPNAHLKKPILIFAATLFISLAVNIPRLNASELLVSSLYLLRWVFYALLFFVVLDLSSFKKRIEQVMIIGGATLVVGGYIQYFLYPDLRNLYYAGWDEHLYRMFSTFLDPNFAGAFFVLYFLFLLNKLFKKKTLIFGFISLVTLIAIVLTFSRSAYIMLVIGTVILLYLEGKKLFSAGLIGLFLVSIIIFGQLSMWSEGTNLLRTASGEARLDSIRNAFTIFKDHPIFGVGFNSYRYAQRDYGFLNEKKKIVHSGAGTDNSFLFILATAGIVGFLAFVYLFFNISLIKDPLVISSISALMVNSLFINSLFYPPIMFWMWIFLAVRWKNT